MNSDLVVPRIARVAAAVAGAAAISCGSHTAPSCVYSVNPTAVTVPSGGGPGTINVTASDRCTWTAASNASWIALLVALPPGHTGNGSAQFVVGPNDGSPRTGTLTVAGRTITVTQGAIAVSR